MKKKYPASFMVVFACAIACALITLHGCASANPNVGQPVIDPVTHQPATNAAGQPVIQPPFVPNTTGTKIVDYASPYVGLIPPPYNTAAELALALATGVMGWIANRKNSQLVAVVQGVEDGTAQPTVTADGVKKAIQARATASGVQTALDATVQKLT